MTTKKITESHVTALEAAELLGVTRQRVYQMLSEGRFTDTRRIGKWLWLIPRSQVDAMRASRSADESEIAAAAEG